VTPVELIERVQSRGGQIRVVDSRLQYRPAGVLAGAERQWLAQHRHEVVDDLLRREGLVELPPERPLGAAGPDVPAWRCYVAITVPHERVVRPDGTEYCGTCHPRTIASGPRR
jgi:hypothetical protein